MLNEGIPCLILVGKHLQLSTIAKFSYDIGIVDINAFFLHFFYFYFIELYIVDYLLLTDTNDPCSISMMKT